MSYKATNWAYDLPLIGSKKFVLVALADMADEAMSCFPSQDRLASMTGRSVKTVERALGSLERLGLISRVQRHDEHGWRTSDRYKLHTDVLSLPDISTDRDAALPDITPTRHPDDQGDGLPDTMSGLPDTVTGQRELRSLEPPVGTINPPTPHGVVALIEPDVTFEDFWAVWPRKDARKPAERAWGRAVKRTAPAVIVAAAAAYAASPWRPERQFVPYGGTWLNQERWHDPLPEPPEQRRPSKPDKDQQAYAIVAMGAEMEAAQDRKAITQ